MQIDKNFNINTSNLTGMRWIDPLTEDVKFYGFNYIDEDRIYSRLPKKYFKEIEEVSPKIGFLKDNTSSGQVHFITNSKKLVIHAKVLNGAHLSGMTYVGQAGFDCYVGSCYEDLLFYESARFDVEKDEYEFTLFQGENDKEKLVVINFPLYSNVINLYFAIDENSFIKKPCEMFKNKIVYYGTSITQGGCASRPGLTYLNIMSRRMKTNFINFGFSGNAFGEKLFAKIMSEIDDADMFVIDYEANGGTNGKLELTLEEFINTIRSKHKSTPIVVISRIKYLFDELRPDLGKRRGEIRLFQEEMVKKFKQNGDSNIYYIDGREILGENYHEFTIDTVHPNDLGFMKMADYLEKEFTKILK